MATEITQSSQLPTKSFVERFGSDVGDNMVVKALSGIGGAVAGGLIGKAIGDSHFAQTGNPLAAGLGAVIGCVAAYKVIPEIATDIQRANQSVDQDVITGTSEGNFADRFKAAFDNILNFGGQTHTPSIFVDDSPEIE